MGCHYSHPHCASEEMQQGEGPRRSKWSASQPRCLPKFTCRLRSSPHEASERLKHAQAIPYGHPAAKADAGVVLSLSAVPNSRHRPSPAETGPPTQKRQERQRQEAHPPSSQQQQQHELQVTGERHIPLELLLLCAQHLTPNEVTCTVRALCRETHAALSPDPRHRTARLDAPLPPQVATWSSAALDNARGPFLRLSFIRKLSLPAIAAATGSIANLDLAWRLLRPCLFPERPMWHYTSQLPDRADPGVVAARAGRADIVVWLVERRCPLVPRRVARAAAVYCDLAGLQKAWGALLQLDPGLGAQAEACWRAVKEAADSGLIGGSGAGVDGAGGSRGFREVHDKGAWLFARHQDHKARQQRQQQQRQQRQQDTLHPEPVWRWRGRPSGASEAAGSGCSERRMEAGPGCRYRDLDWELAGRYRRLLKAARAGNVVAVRGMLPVQQQQQVQQEQQDVGGVGDGGDGKRVHLCQVENAFMELLKAEDTAAAYVLLQAGYRPDEWIYPRAAKGLGLTALRWLLLEARPCPFGLCRHILSLLESWPAATNAAEEREAMEVLRLLVEAGCTGGNDSLVEAAARRGSKPLLREALRLAPPNVFLAKRGNLAFYLLPHLAAGGSGACLDLRFPRSMLEGSLDWCYRTWEGAAWRGDKATLECLRRMGLRWDSRELDKVLRSGCPWGGAPVFWAPVTVPVLRWAVEEAGCWELGAAACRRLAGGVEAALRTVRELNSPQIDWPEYSRFLWDMKAVGAWLMAKAERLERAEGLGCGVWVWRWCMAESALSGTRSSVDRR